MADPHNLIPLILGILFLAAFTRSAFGFGDALVAMPLLALLLDIRTAAPLAALMGYTTGVALLARNWRRVEFHGLWRLSIAGIVGVPVGLMFLKGSHDFVIRFVLAVVIIGFGLYRLCSPRTWAIKEGKKIYLFGFVSGILGGAYNSSGPPVVMYSMLTHRPPHYLRATLQGYFLVTGVFVLAAHELGGLWTPRVLRFYESSLPVIGLAIVLGHQFFKRIPRGKFDNWIHGLLVLAGMVLLVETAVQMH